MTGAVGYAGLASLSAWLILAWWFGIDGPLAALSAVVVCASVMTAWSLLIDGVHRRPSTGINWERPAKSIGETLDISLTKLAGLWCTWGLIAICYACGRWYWTGSYTFAMAVLTYSTPVLVLVSIPYVLWLDRRLMEPRDGSYAFGAWLLGLGAVNREALADHARQWVVKGFFITFMLSILPGNYAQVVDWDIAAALADPVSLTRWLIAVMFLIDVVMASVGYLLTIRPLDAHIRSANPYAAGWTAALICYPPFILMGQGGPLYYQSGTRDWSYWLAGHPWLLTMTGAILVVLTAVYAWATVAFGPRFSNLTNRGILTHGPYRMTRHPAYLSKNMFWWLSTLPFLVTTGLVDMVRNTAMLAAVSSVYYWRARTEERHLGMDPAYRAYSEWIGRHGLLSRWTRRIGGSSQEPGGGGAGVAK